MLPDQVSNPGPVIYESGALLIALHGSAVVRFTDHPNMTLDVYHGCKTTAQQSGKNIWKTFFFQVRKTTGNFVFAQGNLDLTSHGNLNNDGIGSLQKLTYSAERDSQGQLSFLK